MHRFTKILYLLEAPHCDLFRPTGSVAQSVEFQTGNPLSILCGLNVLQLCFKCRCRQLIEKHCMY